MSKARPVVAIDCDGVLVDNAPVWDRYFSEGNCGKKHSIVYDPSDWNRYDKLCKRCWNHVLHSPDILYVTPPRPDAEYFLPILATQFDLWMVTSRHESTAEVTRNWLFWNGLLQHFKGTIFASDKLATCRSIGAIALLDDAAKNLEALVGSEVTPIAWNFPYNQHLVGMRRVSTWAEATKEILNVATGLVPE